MHRFYAKLLDVEAVVARVDAFGGEMPSRYVEFTARTQFGLVRFACHPAHRLVSLGLVCLQRGIPIELTIDDDPNNMKRFQPYYLT